MHDLCAYPVNKRFYFVSAGFSFFRNSFVFDSFLSVGLEKTQIFKIHEFYQ